MNAVGAPVVVMIRIVFDVFKSNCWYCWSRKAGTAYFIAVW